MSKRIECAEVGKKLDDESLDVREAPCTRHRDEEAQDFTGTRRGGRWRNVKAGGYDKTLGETKEGEGRESRAAAKHGHTVTVGTGIRVIIQQIVPLNLREDRKEVPEICVGAGRRCRGRFRLSDGVQKGRGDEADLVHERGAVSSDRLDWNAARGNWAAQGKCACRREDRAGHTYEARSTDHSPRLHGPLATRPRGPQRWLPLWRA
jgi:hypothetical protein